MHDYYISARADSPAATAHGLCSIPSHQIITQSLRTCTELPPQKAVPPIPKESLTQHLGQSWITRGFRSTIKSGPPILNWTVVPEGSRTRVSFFFFFFVGVLCVCVWAGDGLHVSPGNRSSRARADSPAPIQSPRHSCRGVLKSSTSRRWMVAAAATEKLPFSLRKLGGSDGLSVELNLDFHSE